jgi:hypothetical protein
MQKRRMPIVIQRALDSSCHRPCNIAPELAVGMTREVFPMNHASKRAGRGFWLLWVAASTVGFALGSIAHGNSGKLLTDATPAVIATIVTVGLYP